MHSMVQQKVVSPGATQTDTKTDACSFPFIEVVRQKNLKLATLFPEQAQSYSQGPISQTDLSWASYHLVLDLSPKTDLSLLVKSELQICAYSLNHQSFYNQWNRTKFFYNRLYLIELQVTINW